MNPLEVSSAEFQALAEEVAAFCAEYLAELPNSPSFPESSGAATKQAFQIACPEEGIGPEVLKDLNAIVQHSRVNSPRFFGYVFGSGEPVAAIGDFFASVLNQNVTAWRSGPAATTIERTVVRWLAEAVGCKGFSGSLVGGGSSANTMALTMAREAKLPANQDGARAGTIYVSEEVHMSIPKAVALLGLGHNNVRRVRVDEAFRMIPAELDRMISEDRAAGRVPIAVVASAGTVTTGSIDRLAEIAEIAHRHGAWFHVDGAYGALAAIAEPEKFPGLQQADSLSLDPHKWLYQPADIGCLLYKDAGWARAAFSHTGEYAKSLLTEEDESFAFFEESMELSRRFRAMKLWFSLRYHGMAAFRDAISVDLALAQHLAERIKSESQLELLAPVPLSAVCFRAVREAASDQELNDWNARILHRVVYERRRVYISNASIHGKFALRVCIVNHRTTEADVDAVVEEVLAAAKEVSK
jgi:glutamate/tyrosine decarboxylase-like PLP-dependent enzyme